VSQIDNSLSVVFILLRKLSGLIALPHYLWGLLEWVDWTHDGCVLQYRPGLYVIDQVFLQGYVDAFQSMFSHVRRDSAVDEDGVVDDNHQWFL